MCDNLLHPPEMAMFSTTTSRFSVLQLLELAQMCNIVHKVMLSATDLHMHMCTVQCTGPVLLVC